MLRIASDLCRCRLRLVRSRRQPCRCFHRDDLRDRAGPIRNFHERSPQGQSQCGYRLERECREGHDRCLHASQRRPASGSAYLCDDARRHPRCPQRDRPPLTSLRPSARERVEGRRLRPRSRQPLATFWSRCSASLLLPSCGMRRRRHRQRRRRLLSSARHDFEREPRHAVSTWDRPPLQRSSPCAPRTASDTPSVVIRTTSRAAPPASTASRPAPRSPSRPAGATSPPSC